MPHCLSLQRFLYMHTGFGKEQHTGSEARLQPQCLLSWATHQHTHHSWQPAQQRKSSGTFKVAHATVQVIHVANHLSNALLSHTVTLFSLIPWLIQQLLLSDADHHQLIVLGLVF